MNSTFPAAGPNAGHPSKRLLRILSQFTIQEHLEVQRQIEQCAYRLWVMCGGQAGQTLGCWLKAESLVLGRFIKARTRALNKTRTRNGTKPSSPERATGTPQGGIQAKDAPNQKIVKQK